MSSLLLILPSLSGISASVCAAGCQEASEVQSEEASGEAEPDTAIEAGTEPEAGGENTPSVDEIFQQVFKKERPALTQDNYAVLIEDINVGTYLITPNDAGKEGSVEATFIRNILSPVLVEEVADQLNALAGDRDAVGFSEIRALGIDVAFDMAQLVLRIDIPANIRTVRSLNLRTLRNRSDIDLVEQSDFSAYASMRGGLTFVEDSANGETGFTRFAADVDLAVNILGVVAEAEIRYDDNRGRKFSRGDIRLTYDDRDSLIRYELGDLSIGRRPFQNAPRIAGFSAFRNFNINPYRNIRPTPEQAFELDRPARVEIVLNGNPIRTYELRSGRYSLRDFPLIPSAGNDIELRITYASGETEIRSFPAFYDLELLANGLIDFAVNFGVPYDDDNGRRNYFDDNYNGTAYIRYGINSTLTAGLNWEGDKDFDLIGAEAVWASPIGTFGLNASTNARKFSMDQSQLTLQYRWRDADVTRDRSIDGIITLTGKEYRTLNQIFTDNLIAKQFRIRAGQKLDEQSRLSIFGGYNKVRGPFGDTYFVGANYSRQFRFGSVSVGAEYRKTEERSGPAFRIGMTIPLGRASVTSSYTTEDNAARIEYNQLSAIGVNSFGFSAGAERRDGTDRQFGRVSYTANRFEASVQQIARNYFTGGGRRDLRTELTFGSAIVMADGHFGLSRPVRDSFALVRADKKAGDYQLAVEPRTGFGSSQTRYSAFSGTFGPAVVPTLTPYFNRTIEVDAPDAPVGTSLGGQVFSINPGYKSGFNLKVGDAKNVSIVGNMTDRDGDPLVYVTADARAAGGSEASKDGDETGAAVQLFTNAKGRFFLESVEAGKTYVITVEVDGQQDTQSVSVPEDVTGLYRLDSNIVYNIDVESAETQETEEQQEQAPQENQRENDEQGQQKEGEI